MITASTEERVELLREFGPSVQVVNASDEELLLALFRGLADPLDALQRPFASKPIPGNIYLSKDDVNPKRAANIPREHSEGEEELDSD